MTTRQVLDAAAELVKAEAGGDTSMIMGVVHYLTADRHAKSLNSTQVGWSLGRQVYGMLMSHAIGGRHSTTPQQFEQDRKAVDRLITMLMAEHLLPIALEIEMADLEVQGVPLFG